MTHENAEEFTRPYDKWLAREGAIDKRNISQLSSSHCATEWETIITFISPFLSLSLLPFPLGPQRKRYLCRLRRGIINQSSWIRKGKATSLCNVRTRKNERERETPRQKWTKERKIFEFYTCWQYSLNFHLKKIWKSSLLEWKSPYNGKMRKKNFLRQRIVVLWKESLNVGFF